ncbi:MAG: hypothetical protein HGA67_00105 [Candidatus Yonathbacteria bacterium]|nr:hypothetical protein [Candidatus Yonathbacteria bacterium]
MKKETYDEKKKRYGKKAQKFVESLQGSGISRSGVTCEDLNIVPVDYGNCPLSQDKQMAVMRCAMGLHGDYIVRIVQLFLKYYAEIDIRIFRETSDSEVLVDIEGHFREGTIAVRVFGDSLYRVRKLALDSPQHDERLMMFRDDTLLRRAAFSFENILRGYHPTEFMEAFFTEENREV